MMWRRDSGPRYFFSFNSHSSLDNLSMPSQHQHLFYECHIRRTSFLTTPFTTKLPFISQTYMRSHIMTSPSGFQSLCHDGGSCILQEREIKSLQHGLRVSERTIGILLLLG